MRLRPVLLGGPGAFHTGEVVRVRLVVAVAAGAVRGIGMGAGHPGDRHRTISSFEGIDTATSSDEWRFAAPGAAITRCAPGGVGSDYNSR